MVTAIISITFLLLVSCIVLLRKTIREQRSELQILRQSDQSLLDEINRFKNDRIKEQNMFFGKVGDHFHGLEYIIEKGNREYLSLVTVLGEYVRGSGWNWPLLEGSKAWMMISSKSDFQYPCLDRTQSDDLKTLIRSICAKEVEPLALVELMALIVSDCPFDKALKMVEYEFRIKRD